MQFQEKHERLLKDIHTALVGDELHPNGLIPKVEKIEKKVDKHDLYFRIGLGLFSASGLILIFWTNIKTIFS